MWSQVVAAFKVPPPIDLIPPFKFLRKQSARLNHSQCTTELWVDWCAAGPFLMGRTHATPNLSGQNWKWWNLNGLWYHTLVSIFILTFRWFTSQIILNSLCSIFSKNSQNHRRKCLNVWNHGKSNQQPLHSLDIHGLATAGSTKALLT